MFETCVSPSICTFFIFTNYLPQTFYVFLNLLLHAFYHLYSELCRTVKLIFGLFLYCEVYFTHFFSLPAFFLRILILDLLRFILNLFALFRFNFVVLLFFTRLLAMQISSYLLIPGTTAWRKAK